MVCHIVFILLCIFELIHLLNNNSRAPGPRGHISEFASALTPEASEWANRLAREEGLLVGPTSGAVVKICCEIACRPEMAGKTIVGIVASSGIRYTKHPMVNHTFIYISTIV